MLAQAGSRPCTTRLSGPVERPGGSQVREMVPAGSARTSSVSNRSTATHERFDVVVAVGALAEDFEEEVEFGRRGDDDAIRPGMEGRVDREGVRVPEAGHGVSRGRLAGGRASRPWVPANSECRSNRPAGPTPEKMRRRGELSEKAKRRFAVGQYTRSRRNHISLRRSRSGKNADWPIDSPPNRGITPRLSR